MNTAAYTGRLARVLQNVFLSTRALGGAPICDAFSADEDAPAIRRIYVINLDREGGRWSAMRRELHGLRARSGRPLATIARRFSALDARYETALPPASEILPEYALADQLFVEPNPLLAQGSASWGERVRMTRQEIAVARSHLEVWKRIAESGVPYTLVLEDDVYFRHGFARALSRAWRELTTAPGGGTAFDLLYLSYLEARTGADKVPVSDSVVRVRRGLWQLSGYVLSARGAQRLLRLLPIRGPVDLWINHTFEHLDVVATNRSLIEQRRGVPSSNSYSILPVLAKVGVLTAEKPLVFAPRALPRPVFAWGEPDSGLTALATALSMLGYRCCHDVEDLPARERERLLTGSRERVFDAYVNVGGIGAAEYPALAAAYPAAKFIVTRSHRRLPHHRLAGALSVAGAADDGAPCSAPRPARAGGWTDGQPWRGRPEAAPVERAGRTRRRAGALALGPAEALELPNDHSDKWELLRRFLGCEYPSDPYPECDDQPQRALADAGVQDTPALCLPVTVLRRDTSPWIVPDPEWDGLRLRDEAVGVPRILNERVATAHFGALDSAVWALRDDTFPSNLALFRPGNVTVDGRGIARLTLRRERTPVREFTAAAVCSRRDYQYGRFRAELKPARGAGLVSGLFLHRNAPRQEIDIEFLGRDTTKLLVNVYFNPGIEGARMEYGYRGTPVLLDLGFDAAEDFHEYEIEWRPTAIRWRVDRRLVYERVTWAPTPIPHLPMQLNVNLWHSRSEELAGRLADDGLPAHTEVRSLEILS